MEHIVQFAVGLDDKTIQEICEKKAAEQIMQDIKEFSHGKQSYTNKLNERPEKLREIFVEEIKNYIKENADSIVKECIIEISKNMMKTKVVKEALNNITEDK